jgi:HK97 family phage portal protein
MTERVGIMQRIKAALDWVDAGFRNEVKNQVKPVTAGNMVEFGDVLQVSTSGQHVTVEATKNVATAYRCINVLSDDVAKLPLQTFVSRAAGQIERVKASSRMENLPWLLEVSPNRWMTPLVFKKTTIMWLLTYGAAYIWQPPWKAGRRRELFILPSSMTRPVFDETLNLWYQVSMPGKAPEMYPEAEVLSLLINSTDGITGRSVISYARETIGRQLAAYETQGKFYSQGLNPGGIIWIASEANKDARQKIRDTYSEAMSGTKNAYRMAVFDNKITKFEPLTMKPIDVQFLESIMENDTEIANFFGVPLYKLNQGKQSYQSNEQQNLDYLNTTLDPYLVQWEQAAALKWLSEEEQNTIYLRFNRDALLRTDAKTRSETLEKRIFSGQLTPNEARQIEDMSAYAGGDRHYVPANMVAVGNNAVGSSVGAAGNNTAGGNDASNQAA